jgi:hypothetical protein
VVSKILIHIVSLELRIKGNVVFHQMLATLAKLNKWVSEMRWIAHQCFQNAKIVRKRLVVHVHLNRQYALETEHAISKSEEMTRKQIALTMWRTALRFGETADL